MTQALYFCGMLSLVLQLGHDSYGVREKASMKLLAVVESKRPHPFLLWGEKHKDPEIAARCRWLVEQHLAATVEVWVEEAKPVNWPAVPWIDCLPYDYPERDGIIGYYLREARLQIKNGTYPDWPDYRLATKLYLRHLYLNRKASEVPTLLKVMAARERQWILDNGKHYNPPILVPAGW